MKLDAKSFGLAAGVYWGLAVLIMTWINIWTGYAPAWFSLMEGFYPGYTVSPVGSVIGLVYGFIDGFVAFFVTAWLYNKFAGNR